MPRASAKTSIVIPTKGRCDLLAETLVSLRAQTYQNWEAVIVDDGSEPEMVRQIAAWAGEEPRIRLIRREGQPSGANRCRNLGLAAATGDYVIFLDSDDCLSPHCLEDRIAQMEAHPDLDFGVFPNRRFKIKPGDADAVWAPDPASDQIDNYLAFRIPWQTAGPIWRRSALERFGHWDERLPSGQDWDFYIQALIRSARYKIFDAPTFYHRLTGSFRVSIGAQNRGPAHLAGREIMIDKAYETLQAAGMLSDRRKRLLAKLHITIAEHWVRCGGRREGRQYWRKCRHAGWYPPCSTLKGRCSCVPRGSPLFADHCGGIYICGGQGR